MAASIAVGVAPIGPDLLHRLGIGAGSDTPRLVAEKFPIGIDPNGRVVLLHLATDGDLGRCRAFVQRHVELLRSVPAWTLRTVLPPWREGLQERYAQVVTEELTATLRPTLISDLRCHFHERCKRSESGWQPADPERFDQAEHAFTTPRLQQLYRRWLTDGDHVFDLAAEGVKHALDSGAGRVETLILSHRYRHLSPLVNATTRSRPGAEKVDETSAPSRPPSIRTSEQTSVPE